MKKLSEKLAKYIPPCWLSIPFLLIFVFLSLFIIYFSDQSDTPWIGLVSGVVYFLTSFLLVLCSVSVFRFIRNTNINEKLSYCLKKIPLLQRICSDMNLRLVLMTYCSLALNVVTSVSKGVIGFYYGSFWAITLSFYYLALCVSRFFLLRKLKKIEVKEKTEDNLKAQWKGYYVCGWIFLIMTIALAGMVALITIDNFSFVYPGTYIYAIAAYDFYCLFSSCYYMVKTRRKHMPLTIALKTISFASSLVSILSLQTALISTFGQPDNSAASPWMNFTTGLVICVLIFSMGVYMIVNGHKKLKRIKKTYD